MKKKKTILFTFLALILIIILFIVLSLPKDYKITYQKDGYTVEEKFIKKFDMYYFAVTKDDKIYEYSTQNKYIHGKELIDEIESYKSEEYECIYFISDDIDTVPVCYEGDESIDYKLVNNDEFKEFYKGKDYTALNQTYNRIDINALLDKKVLIWNYKGYIFLDSENQSEINFLDEESYYNNLSYLSQNYLITANYDEEYNFKSVYIIDVQTGKYEKWELKYEISYNSYFLGDLDGKIYLIDKKNKIEYALNPKKKEIQIITNKSDDGKIWNNGWESVRMSKLSSNVYSFSSDSIYNYILEDDKLYLKYYKGKNKRLVSSKIVDKIVGINNENIYYLVKDHLYFYNPYYGEILLMSYEEWNFNSDNQIFVY